MSVHPWHDIETGAQAPDIVNAVIEIPRGTKAKYELDKPTGLLRLDRVLYSAVFYPANYGFIPRTLGDDHDPLDILVISQEAIQPLCIVKAKIIGVMQMVDNGEPDDKIIAVCSDDVSVSHINDIDALPQYFQSELKNFFEEYKKLEKKDVEVEGFQNAGKAKAIITRALGQYSESYGSHLPTSK